MSFSASFQEMLAAAWPREQWAYVHTVVAVSGGADSVALLRGLLALKRSQPGGNSGRLTVAHINHGLRSQAAADAQFVAEMAQSFQCPCIVEQVDTSALAQRAGDGIEAAARQLRYEALLRIAHQQGARYLATAHTADDQAETILHRILRGTGVGGLAGMAKARPLSDSVALVRPLLGHRREEVLAYLSELQQPHRTDATNADPAFTRNRIRNELLPQLAQQYNPNFVQALLNLGASAAEAQTALEHVAAQLAERTVLQADGQLIELNCQALGEEPEYLRILVMRMQWQRSGWPEQAMSRVHWLRLSSMASNLHEESSKTDFPGGVVAHRQSGGRLILSRLER